MGKEMTHGYPATDLTLKSLKKVPFYGGRIWVHSRHAYTPIVADRVTQDFARLVRREGFPHLTLHGLRHAHATLALSAGVNPKVVSERLGHSTIAVTMDTYSPPSPPLLITDAPAQ